MRLVNRTLDVLETLAIQPEGLGVVPLAELLAEPPATVHRLLTSLAGRGYVLRDPMTRRYKLGVSALRLVQAWQQGDRLVAIARPHLAALGAATQESVFLSELLQDDVVCVASAESPRPLSFFMRPGQRMPYHAGSSARAVLAFMPAETQLRLMRRENLEAYTPLTPVTVEAALEELARTRERGYAVCDREMEAGIVALSVPIRGPDGAVLGSITIVAPENRLSGASREGALKLLTETANAIEAGLGYASSRARMAMAN